MTGRALGSMSQATRDAVRVAITNFLYDDRTGLPQSYAPDKVDVKAAAVFEHVLHKRGGSAAYAV